jgi:chromosome partitioning protein
MVSDVSDIGDVGDVIVVGNTKGGVGKTALAFNLSFCLAELGARVLVVDLDVQCGQGAFLSGPFPDADHDAAAVLTGRCAIGDAVHGVFPNLDLLPANEYSIAYLSRRLDHDDVGARANRLFDDLFRELRRRWDVIIVDTAGHQSPLLGFALAAADGVIVPVSPEAGPVAELSTILNLVDACRGRSERPRVVGIVRTRVWGNAIYRRVAEDQIRKIAVDRGVTLFRNKIPEDAKFGEAHLMGLPVGAHHARARSAVAYRFLAAELAELRGWTVADHDSTART